MKSEGPGRGKQGESGQRGPTFRFVYTLVFLALEVIADAPEKS